MRALPNLSQNQAGARAALESVFDTFLWPQFSESSSRRESAHTSSGDSAPGRSPKDQSGLTSAATMAKLPDGSSRRKEAPTSSEAGRKPDQSLATSAATAAKIDAVAAAARELRRVRAEALPKLKGGLRALYRTLELPGANPLADAHAALDAAVLAACGFDAKKDLLAQLLALNQDAASRIEHGGPITAPGVPPGCPEPERLVTEECISPPTV